MSGVRRRERAARVSGSPRGNGSRGTMMPDRCREYGGASERRERATRPERAGAAAREGACRGGRGGGGGWGGGGGGNPPGGDKMKFSPDYVRLVLNENFEDAKAQFLAPL